MSSEIPLPPDPADDDAFQILDTNPDLEKRVYLKMSIRSLELICQKRKESGGAEVPLKPADSTTTAGNSKFISKSFIWGDVPELADIIKRPDRYKDFYRRNSHPTESRNLVSEFMTALVPEIRTAAHAHGYVVKLDVTEHVIRKRIIAYYKSLYQGSRVRLNRIRKIGRKDIELMALLEECKQEQQEEEEAAKQQREGGGEKQQTKQSKRSREEEDANGDGDSWKKRATVPLHGSYEWHVLQRLQEQPKTVKIGELAAFVDSAVDPDMFALSSLVRVRLASGIFRSTIKLCHDTLQRLYQQAAILTLEWETQVTALKDIRKRLAAVWCFYAELLWKFSSMPAKHGPDHDTVGSDEWKAYALATLSSATSCRLVGNHEMIAVGLARILVSDEESNSQDIILEDVEQALVACEDGIRRHQSVTEPRSYSPTPLQTLDFQRMSKHALDAFPLKKDPTSAQELEASFEKVNKLAVSFDSSAAGSELFLVDPGEPTPAILEEINRLQELKQRLTERNAADSVNASIVTTITAESPSEPQEETRFLHVERIFKSSDSTVAAPGNDTTKDNGAKYRELVSEETDL